MDWISCITRPTGDKDRMSELIAKSQMLNLIKDGVRQHAPVLSKLVESSERVSDYVSGFSETYCNQSFLTRQAEIGRSIEGV